MDRFLERRNYQHHSVRKQNKTPHRFAFIIYYTIYRLYSIHSISIANSNHSVLDKQSIIITTNKESILSILDEL